jgi:hypothetical protein
MPRVRHRFNTRYLGRVVACVLAAVGAMTGTAHAQAILPDVDISLVLNVPEVAGWLEFQNEILGSSNNRPLAATLNAASGSRTILLTGARFGATMVVSGGSVRVVVTGKVTGGEALRNLARFQQAAMEIQTGVVDNDLTIFSGLALLRGQLLELYTTR